MATKPKKNSAAARQRLFTILQDLEVGMLTTVRPDGTLHTRPMVTRFDQPEQRDLWFFTLRNAPKKREIDQDEEVSVAYADPKRRLYATVAGRARVVTDRALMDRLWIASLISWFPKGVEDPALALLHVRIRTGEYWDAPSESMVEIIAAVQEVFDHPPAGDTGEHAKIRLR